MEYAPPLRLNGKLGFMLDRARKKLRALRDRAAPSYARRQSARQLALFDEALRDKGASLSKLVELFAEGRVSQQSIRKRVKISLKQDFPEETSLKILVAYLVGFGIDHDLGRSVLDHMFDGPADRIRDCFEQLRTNENLRPEQELNLLKAMVSLEERQRKYGLVEDLCRTAWHSQDLALRYWGGTKLGTCIGVSLEALATGDVEAAHEGVPDSFRGHIAIIAEAGADLTVLTNNRRFANCRITLYSPESVDTSALGANVSLGSYRDKVPDYSEASNRIYTFAAAAAKKIAAGHLAAFSESDRDTAERYSETTTLAYEDRIAGVLTQLECCDACLDEVNDADAVILIGSRIQRLVRMIPYLFRRRDRTRAYFLPACDNTIVQARSLQAAKDALSSGGHVEPNKSDTPSQSRPAVGALRDALSVRVAKDAYRLGNNYVLLTGQLENQNYATTTTALLHRLLQEPCKVFVYIASTREIPTTDDFLNERVFATNLLELEPRIDAALTHLYENVTRFTRPIIAALPSYHMGSVSELLCLTTQQFEQSSLQRSMGRFIYFEELFSASPPKLAILSTPRLVRVRGLAQITAEMAIPSIDVQTLNVHKHAKYKAPFGDRATVIDHLSKDIYRDYHGYPEQRILVTGTPRVDDIRKDVESHDVAELRCAFNIPCDNRPIMLFASQLQPLERCQSILRQMCAVARDNGAGLVVKLHPREGASRSEAYKRIIEDYDLADRARIIGSAPISQMLAISHVVVTMFSNVAREALLVGRHVIIANYFDSELPLRFDRDAGAVGAYSPEELYQRLAECLGDWAPGIEYQPKQSPYMQANPHLTSGRSADRIIAAAFELASAPGSAVSFPDPTDGQLASRHATDLVDLVVLGLANDDETQALQLMDRLLAAGLGEVLACQGIPDILDSLERSYQELDGRVPQVVDCLIRALADVPNITCIEQLARKTASHESWLQSALVDAAAASSSIYARIFAAHILIESGMFRKASSVLGIALSQTDDGKLRPYLESLVRALEPLHAVPPGHSSSPKKFNDVRDAVLIVDKDVPVSVAIDYVNSGQYSEVITESTELGAELGDIAIASRTFQDIYDDYSPVIAGVVRDVADAFSEEFADEVIRFMKEDTGSDFGVRHRAAIFHWMRQSLIGLRRNYIMQSVIQKNKERPVVILISRRDSVSLNWDPVDPHENIWFAAGDKNIFRSLQLRDAIEPELKETLELSEIPAPSYERRRQAGEELRRLTRNHHPPILVETTADRVLIVVRWKLPTTLPTILKLISKIPENVEVAILAADPEDTQSEMETALQTIDISETAAARVRPYTGVKFGSDDVPGWVARDFAAILASRCLKSPSLLRHGLDMRHLAKKRIYTFARETLFKLISFDREVQRYLGGDGRSIVAVSPGRHPEAIIAQTVARSLGKESVDIQVAYWSKSYRYERPYGSIVTAIDIWSADLLRDHFKVPSEAIHVVGTPRFDSIVLSLHKAQEVGREPRNFGFASSMRPLVCFASQHGFTDAKMLITRKLCEARCDCGPINVLIKLHPKDTEKVETYERAIKSFASVNDVKVIQNEPIHAVIAASDVIVTMFSNVGIEAAISGKKLLVVKLQDEMPLPLDRFSIGANAYDGSQIGPLLNRLLTDEAFAEKIQAQRREFFSLNSHLLRGDSTSSIWRILMENLH